jgi:hypothetical protein
LADHGRSTCAVRGAAIVIMVVRTDPRSAIRSAPAARRPTTWPTWGAGSCGRPRGARTSVCPRPMASSLATAPPDRFLRGVPMEIRIPRIGQQAVGIAACFALGLAAPISASAADRDRPGREFLEMFWMIITKGADMGPTDGWFHPSLSRFGWSWLKVRLVPPIPEPFRLELAQGPRPERRRVHLAGGAARAGRALPPARPRPRRGDQGR